jgi:hypothetical protein
MLENPKVQFRLNNPDTQETLGIRHITKINNNNKTDHRKLKDEQHEPLRKKTGVKPGAGER